MKWKWTISPDGYVEEDIGAAALNVFCRCLTPSTTSTTAVASTTTVGTPTAVSTTTTPSTANDIKECGKCIEARRGWCITASKTFLVHEFSGTVWLLRCSDEIGKCWPGKSFCKEAKWITSAKEYAAEILEPPH